MKYFETEDLPGVKVLAPQLVYEIQYGKPPVNKEWTRSWSPKDVQFLDADNWTRIESNTAHSLLYPGILSEITKDAWDYFNKGGNEQNFNTVTFVTGINPIYVRATVNVEQIQISADE